MWWIVILLLIFRLYQANSKFYYWFLFIASWLLFLLLFNTRQLNQQLKNEYSLSNQQLIVEPDQLKIDGNLVKLTGYWVEGKQKVQGYYQLQSQNEQKKWSEISTPINLKFNGQIVEISPPTNENQFDYQLYARSQLIVNQIFIKKVKVSSVLRENLLAKLIDWLHQLRILIIRKLGSLPEPLNGYSQLLLVGYSDIDFEQQVSIINQLGLLYLFSLSGMHVVYLMQFLKTICRWIGMTKEGFNYLCLIGLPIYAFIGGLSASLIRAVCMSWLVIFVGCFNLRISRTSALCVVLLINLIYSPLQLFSIGFQLSYLLTFIIIEGSKLNQLFLGLKLNAYSFPIVLWHTYQWNFLTWILTIAIIPIFEWLIIPAVLGGCLFPPLTGMANQVLDAINGVFNWLATLPFMLTFGKPPLILLVTTIIVLNLIEVSWVTKKAFLILGLFVFYLVIALSIKFPLFDEVVYFDIGQGDSTLIRTRFNRSISLVDTGGKVSFTNEKWQIRHSKTNGETVVANYLLSQGIDHLDNLFLTHQDTDHIGNFPSIAKKIQIERVIIPAGMEKSQNFIRRLKQAGVVAEKVLPVKTSRYQQIGIFKLLHPFKDGTGTNEDSLVLWFELNKFKFIISGDLDQAGEEQVIKKYPNIQADFLKTGHHGSKTSTAPVYVKQLEPSLAIISAGKNNRYGHPNQETLATLEKFKVPFVCTINSGMIKIKMIRNNLKIIYGKNNNQEDKIASN